MKADHHTSHARGLVAEGIAAWLLRLKGYRVLATRYRTPLGEIDIVARRGKVLAFVEVKARPSLGAGLEAITDEGYRRIEAAADLYLAKHPQFSDFTLRFDLMVVRPRRWPHHVENAFS